MDILCIGGTRFSGRAFTEAATAAGHRITVFHRGRSGGDLPVEHVLGDREHALGQLAGRRFDAVVDFCAYTPEQVEAAVATVQAERWVLISSVSAHPLDVPPGTTEAGPVHAPAPPGTALTGETYGALKVACEQALRGAVGERAAVVRPGFIVGPRDETDRFPSLVRRAAAGGRMLVPGPEDDVLQYVDARALGRFVLGGVERGLRGTYNAVQPPVPVAEVLQAARRAAGADTELGWVDPEALRAALTPEERGRAFPMWGPEYPGLHRFDGARAAAAGLIAPPVVETVTDTLTWLREAGRPTPGLPPDREQALLATLA